MIGQPFINPVISNAIELYLKYKDHSDDPVFKTFPVMAIRTLIFIYGELDILNPYITHNEHSMGGFDSNLMKYGFSAAAILDFKQQFVVFEEEKQQGIRPNKGFVKIQKYLIDMFCIKQKSMRLQPEQFALFKQYLYIPENTDKLAEMQLYLTDMNEVQGYLNSKYFEASHQFTLQPVARDLLMDDAYLLLGYNLGQISQLSDTDLRAVNEQVYRFFRVDSQMPNSKELLMKAVNYYKRYGNRVTTGNGYVDFLLFISVAATAILIVTLVAIQYF